MTDPKHGDALHFGEVITAEVWRGTGGPYRTEPDETLCVEDLITNDGRVYLAQRIGADVNSPIAHMAVGTATGAPALTDSALVGEVGRKALSTNSAQTNNVYTAVATWGGAADSVTSLAITEAGLFNHANSGNGTMYQRVKFAAVTLANSDLFKLTLETNVGSNTI